MEQEKYLIIIRDIHYHVKLDIATTIKTIHVLLKS